VLALRAVPGCGVEAEIEAAGTRHAVRIGTPDWIGGDAELERQLKATGHRVRIAVDGELAAVAVLAEHLRDSASEAVAEFRRLGLTVEVLTGDTAARAAALGLPARGGLLPDDKRAAVEDAKAAGGRPLFVGDGINDASALASAHAGVALAAGTDLAVGAADATLYHADLRVLPWAVELSREAVRAVRRNLCRALCYNLVGMTLAACGVLHPVVAVVLMVLSSLSLVYSSTRVGVTPDHCRLVIEPVVTSNTQGADAPRSEGNATRQAAVHGTAFALQGVVLLFLLGAANDPVPAVGLVGAFALIGFALARLWHRWATIPHAISMCFGMLTLGNFGMLLGWWADSGFTPLPGHCRECVAALQEGVIRAPWMWVGMLAFANVAMLWLPRRARGRGRTHSVAMYTGGNAGMVLGMTAGAWCAAQFEAATITGAVITSFAGMTAGMLAGMLAGTWLTERLAGAARALALLPRWLRSGSGDEVVGGEAEADRDDRVADVARG
jgi:cation transport ATPase